MSSGSGTVTGQLNRSLARIAEGVDHSQVRHHTVLSLQAVHTRVTWYGKVQGSLCSKCMSLRLPGISGRSPTIIRRGTVANSRRLCTPSSIFLRTIGLENATAKCMVYVLSLSSSQRSVVNSPSSCCRCLPVAHAPPAPRT